MRAGRLVRSPAGSSTAGHTVAIIDSVAEAFDRLRHGLRGPAIAGIGFDVTASRRPASRRPALSRPSPTATTRTSWSPASPERRSASSGSSPASTTPGGPRSTSGSASRRSPPSSWTTERVLRAHPPRASRQSTGSTRARRCASSSGPIPVVGGSAWCPSSSEPGGLRLVGDRTPRRRADPQARPRRPGGRRRSYFAVGGDAHRRASTSASPQAATGRH